MSPERKAEVDVAKQSENKENTQDNEKKENIENKETKMSENIEITKYKELQEKVKKMETEKLNNLINELKQKNRDILLPKFDEYIDVFVKKFSEIDEIVKFSEKEYNLLEIFYKFINDFVSAKKVIFSEMAKDNDYELEEEKQKIISSIEGQGYKVSNVDLALLAKRIQEKENITYYEALQKAKKKLNK